MVCRCGAGGGGEGHADEGGVGHASGGGGCREGEGSRVGWGATGPTCGGVGRAGGGVGGREAGSAVTAWVGWGRLRVALARHLWMGVSGCGRCEAGRHSVPRRGRRLATGAGCGHARGLAVNCGVEHGGCAGWSGGHGGCGGSGWRQSAAVDAGRGVAVVIGGAFI